LGTYYKTVDHASPVLLSSLHLHPTYATDKTEITIMDDTTHYTRIDPQIYFSLKDE
jgi:hypothetical protein